MRNKVKISLTLYFFFSLLTVGTAADFTISGKVSLIQEAVPLPFYEVNIADGAGKYVVTVKTGFNGNYQHTFDIPEDEKVSFEVAVIDRCTNQPVILAFEKEGDQATASFIICNPNEEETEEDPDDEKEEDTDNTDNSFCPCPQIYHPVCVVLEDGSVFEFSNECFALCEGYLEFSNCPDDEEDNANNPCENLDLNIPVCFTTDEGETISFPDPCAAFEAGYQWDQLTLCEDYADINPISCAALDIDLPISVCVVDDAGEELELPVCEAFAKGYSFEDIQFCNGLGGLGGLNCELLGIDIPVNVCVKDEEENVLELPLCSALAEGYPLSQMEFCNLNPEITDEIDCAALGIDLPVCTTNEDGGTTEFESPCAALDAGIAIEALSFCNGGFNDPANFDCEALGLDIDLPVCVSLENGDLKELSLCAAISEGLDPSSLVLCDGTPLDCALLGLDIPVCVSDTEGNKVEYPNPCEALAAGNSIDQLTICDHFADDILEEFDCITLGLDLPIPVCLINEAGEEESISLCEALEQGISPQKLQLCSNSLEVINPEDCAALGLNIPVCVTLEDGSLKEFPNPCEAIAAGIALEALTFCENLLEKAIEDMAFSTDTKEVENLTFSVDIFPNPVQNQLNIQWQVAKKTQFEIRIQSISSNAIYRQKFNTSKGLNMHTLDVSSLPEGIHVLQVVNEEFSRTFKFIKIR